MKKLLLLAVLVALASNAQAYDTNPTTRYEDFRVDNDRHSYEQQKAEDRRRMLEQLDRDTSRPEPQGVRCYREYNSVYCTPARY